MHLLNFILLICLRIFFCYFTNQLDQRIAALYHSVVTDWAVSLVNVSHGNEIDQFHEVFFSLTIDDDE